MSTHTASLTNHPHPKDATKYRNKLAFDFCGIEAVTGIIISVDNWAACLAAECAGLSVVQKIQAMILEFQFRKLWALGTKIENDVKQYWRTTTVVSIFNVSL